MAQEVNLGAQQQQQLQQKQEQSATAPVVLVSMPFGPLLTPSLGLSLLKAELAQVGICADIRYYTIKFAQRIGVDTYLEIADGRSTDYDLPNYLLIGEWLFSKALFFEHSIDDEGYVQNVLLRPWEATRRVRLIPEKVISRFFEIREQVEPFLSECLTDLLAHNPRLVGFTSVFQQHVASLALARRLKAEAPDVFIVFGGANCEGVMGAETLRQFQFIDAVVSGEGDIVFPQIVQKVFAGESINDLPGVFTRPKNSELFVIGVNGSYPVAPLVRNMDSLPVPDFRDFFEQYRQSSIDGHYKPRLLYESSRGCWWGQKHHCTFCGLNGSTMSFRAKSGARVLQELMCLADKYPDCAISVVDNILDMKYFADLLPALAEQQKSDPRRNIELFYEVKANLHKDQVRKLKEAGVTIIQPGIESLDDHVLRLMRKGVSALQNIQLLKWCKEYGIRPMWNLLWGFPREDPDAYKRMAQLIPLLTHLQPPKSAARVRLDRFSPNFDLAHEFGFRNVQPFTAYHYVYTPLNAQAVTNLAYFFTYDYEKPQDVEEYTAGVEDAVRDWKVCHEVSDLFAVDKGEVLLIWDLRPIAQRPLTVLRGVQKLLYLSCDAATSITRLQRMVAEFTSEEISEEQVNKLLQPMIDSHLMIRDGRSVLSLAIPLGVYSPPLKVLQRFQHILESYRQPDGTFVVPFAPKQRSLGEPVGVPSFVRM